MPPEGILTLPSWDIFLQLTRNMLENPRLAFSLPQLFRKAAISIYKSSDFLEDSGRQDLLLIKYAMLVSNYFCRAAKFPPELRTILEEKFIKKQSFLVHSERISE